MKGFITRNWKKILIFIGIIAVAWCLIYKFTVPKTLDEDYIKYGKVTETPGIVSKIVDSSSSISNDMITPGLVKIGVIIIGAIILIAFITGLTSRKSADKKKK